jgi:hypothetical protein
VFLNCRLKSGCSTVKGLLIAVVGPALDDPQSSNAITIGIQLTNTNINAGLINCPVPWGRLLIISGPARSQALVVRIPRIGALFCGWGI